MLTISGRLAVSSSRFLPPGLLGRSISIPVEKIDFSFSRSSGPGGQNVNKVNTRAEIRFKVMDAEWLPEDVRGRLLYLQANRINNDGELILTSQEHRTQARNKDVCLAKLKQIISEAEFEPKERNHWEGIGDKGKDERRVIKERRADIKSNRIKNRAEDE